MSIINPLDRGLLTVSVDFGGDLSETTGRPVVDQILQWLLSTLNRYGIEATWGVDDPASFGAVDQVNRSNFGHEVAVWGDSSWVGSAADRGTFSRELSHRVLSARAAGIPVSTLITPDVLVEDHLDLLVKHQITAVRGLVDRRGRSTRAAQPHRLHYGLWEIPGSLRLPGDRRWAPGGGRTHQAHCGIRRAAAARSVYHLVIDAPQLSVAKTLARRGLDRVLRAAVQLRQQGQLYIEPLARSVDRLSWRRPLTPSRSILRRAG